MKDVRVRLVIVRVVVAMFGRRRYVTRYESHYYNVLNVQCLYIPDRYSEGFLLMSQVDVVVVAIFCLFVCLFFGFVLFIVNVSIVYFLNVSKFKFPDETIIPCIEKKCLNWNLNWKINVEQMCNSFRALKYEPNTKKMKVGAKNIRI